MSYTNINVDTEKRVNLTPIDIDIDRAKQEKYSKSKIVDNIANQLVENFNSPNSRAFYCKVAYKLPENKIWANVESANRGRSPVKLFTWLCNRDMS